MCLGQVAEGPGRQGYVRLEEATILQAQLDG